MTHFKQFFTVIFAALLLCGCSKKKQFIVQGEIDGIGSQLVNATYYAGGGLKRVTAGSSDNKFALHGESTRPTLVSVTLADGTPLATLVVENGDKITLKGNIAKPYDIEVSGNGDSEKIAKWVNENSAILEARNAEAINQSLARWVGKNRSSKAATALMVTYFYTPGHEHQADSLMTLLSTDARSQEVVQNFTGVLSAQLGDAENIVINPMNLYDVSDSVISVNPRSHNVTLLCFVSDNRMARDSIVPHLAELMRKKRYGQLDLVEISTAADSATWRQSLAGDTATWRRTWAPATVASATLRKLAIPRNPYFIVADSAGTQIYRGGSISQAKAAVLKKL
ncbi:MAG: DUF4369 domain-containing protein [Firmicutes bacterium]|nr:DUF4369 domain-containing protein [Bacillota bacterium]MCM1400586.1 DUF4369 domain-containing protein [Bacteroides sp.]